MDNYIVSARKYRPSTFHSVVGQKSLTTTLKNAIINNKLAHAYLFCGPRGVGKTTCARIFAKTINCFHPTPDGEACNECESCRSFNENRSLNIHELDAASNNSVDDIRALTEQVRIMPQLGKYKVYIIDEVHMLTQSAFNAFLKTLEEPPHHAVFILATTEKHKILPTILSRCQIYDFNRIGINDIVEYLEYVAKQENISCEREALNIIAQKADGGMRDALSIFDQVVSFSQGNVTYKTVIENLNVLDYDYYFRITDAILQNDVPKCLLLLNEILSKGFDGQHIISGLALFFRDLLVCKDPQTLVLFEVGDAVKEKYLESARCCETAFLYKAMELTNETDLNYRYSKNKRFSIELLLIRLCQLKASSEGSDKKKIVIEAISQKGDLRNSENATDFQDSKNTVAPNVPKISTEAGKLPEAPGKSIVRVRLNGNPEQTGKPETVSSQAEKPIQDLPFSREDLIQSWKNYANQTEDVYLKNTMAYINPQLKDGYKIEAEMLNPKQADHFRENSPAIREYLASALRNSRIELDIKIKTEDHTQTLFTDKEKYLYMVNKNPSLKSLVQKFNLRLD
ncbi:MAG: DNA polymerase III subunit gamma/tau [Dysgonamonadaceae bacterium]|jgi:DNA polymerase-3 subunit gamma/tau|nr:DNA polymerase III subunit gamma/tau [Dysgonamonadaceae bacterium]